MLIVIGGDSYYKDEDEEDKFVISRWARRKVASQFDEEYLDGRKSFIFSWDTKHRPIHEEALRQYLDPAKKGVTFVFTPKPKPLPRAAEPEFISPASQDALEEVGPLLCYILSACLNLAPCTVSHTVLRLNIVTVCLRLFTDYTRNLVVLHKVYAPKATLETN